MELSLVKSIQNEPADRGVGGERVLLAQAYAKHTSHLLMKRHGPRFQSEMIELLCLLYMKRMSCSEERFPGSYMK